MKEKTSALIISALFTGLTAIAAFIRIPTPIVPITLQVMIVILSGLVLKPGPAALSQIAYITIGLAGVPIFTEGGGIHYILSPTFGYLLGYIPAAWLVSKIKEKNSKVLIAALAGVASIYFIGTTVLFFNLRLIAKADISIWGAIKIGVIPFIAPDIFKSLAAVALAKKIENHVK